MTPQTRKAALRATAKIALSLTVVGCAGEVTTASSEQDFTEYPVEEPIDDPSDPSDPVDEPVEQPEELVCQAPAWGEEVTLDETQLTCCGEHVSPQVPVEDWEEFLVQAATDDDLKACCGVIVAHVEADFANMETIGSDTLWACCAVLENPMGPACTPWGPPVPPAFDITRRQQLLLAVAAYRREVGLA